VNSLPTCPLCERPILRSSDHHLVPKCREGKAKEKICADCHEAIHALFSNKELEGEYSSVEALLGNERFRATVKFISRQDPARRTRTVLAKNQRGRGRNG
jgi:hypothetical protein